MDGNDGSGENGDGGVRRRHSSHYDDDDRPQPDSDNPQVETRPSDRQSQHPRPKSAVTDRDHEAAVTSTAVDGFHAPIETALGPIATKVRFSEDVERPNQPRVADSTLHGDPGQRFSASDSSNDVSNARTGPLGLSIDVTAAAASRGAVLAQGLVGSPVSSPATQRARNVAHPSPLSPVSPRSRNRGYSLRRSLFAKSFHSDDGRGSVLELEPAGPSTSKPDQGISTSGGESSNGKKPGPTVMVKATADESSLLAERLIARAQAEADAPARQSHTRRLFRLSGIPQASRFAYDKVIRLIPALNETPPSQHGRHFTINPRWQPSLIDERTGSPFIGNTIRSCRYTVWNFLPRQLFAQFSKLANFYFLCVSILQMIPNLSTTGTFTTIVPLLFFVSLSMAKEGYDDFRRYRLDKAENGKKTFVLGPDNSSSASPPSRSAKWLPIGWNEVRVGDVVRLARDDAVPADLLLLHSNGLNGQANVETMALDGETNLKSKQAPQPLMEQCSTVDGLASCDASLTVEDPNLDLYNFEGKVAVAGETIPLTNSEVIYRGSVLRNTEEAVGLVIYSGEECKIRMNATKNPRIKAPSLQSRVNKIVILTVFFVIFLAIFNTVAYQIWGATTEDDSWYLTNANVAFFPIFASFVIMFNTLIPLSLYVSLEIVKLCQILLMNDIDMYDEASNTPMEPRTSTINEELGQVNYIFSDKTGTLTDNSMRFRKISVAGTAWLHDFDMRQAETNAERQLRHKLRKGKDARKRKSVMSEMSLRRKERHSDENSLMQASDPRRNSSSASAWQPLARPSRSQPELRTDELLRYLQRKPHTVFAAKARHFLISIALCHTCLPEVKDNGDLDFQASSPDELALVRAAQELGFMVTDRQAGTISLKLYPLGLDRDPVTEVYEILDVIEFSSKRKRMSIILRLPDQRICIFCKGADSTLVPLLRHAKLAQDKVREVSRRANQRKSMEVQHVKRRTSEHLTRKESLSRPSASLSRGSIGALGRPSMTANRLQPIRDEISSWLTNQERDVDISSLGDESVYYTPRPSMSAEQRASYADSTARSSFADDFADDLVDESLVVDEPAVFERCFQHINDFATEGLRTLLYGHRYIKEEEYADWKRIYMKAVTSLVDRQQMVERAGDLIEKDFELSGATAIEDKLQQGVPQAIDKLRRAGVKMWMLTGDKRETAINIGHSCRLIKDYSTVTTLDHEVGPLEYAIADAVIDIEDGNVVHSVVVIDGQTLAKVEGDKVLASLFFDLAVRVDSVICCRASPSQKAGLVNAIRKKVKRSITLAIGDGANDIAMIQEAHVGIGITGKEGLQAARTADYSIGQFRFLLKLLLVHGRWNYVRTCRYTLGTFWKEVLFYLTQALYQRWAGYTGTSLYESWSLSMFNTLFTSLPVIFIGIFEKDLAASTLLAVPELYKMGQRSGAFNFKIYLYWIFLAASEAMVIYFMMLGLFGQMLFSRDNSLYAMGTLTFTCCVVFISSKLLLIEMHNKSIMVVIGCVLSVGGWFFWNILLSLTYRNNTIYNVRQGILRRFGQDIVWWLVVILVAFSCTVFEVGLKSLQSAWFPTDVDLFQEYEQDRFIRQRFEEAAATELQQGWKRDGKDPPDFRRDSATREGDIDIQELLDRPRVMEQGGISSSSPPPPPPPLRRRHPSMEDSTVHAHAPLETHRRSSDGTQSVRRSSADLVEMLKKGFGNVKQDH